MRSILRNGAYLLGAGWLATTLRATYVVILARALGPQDYGLLSSAQALYLMFVIGGTAGVASYVAREVAAGRAAQREALWSALAVEGIFLAVGAAAFLSLTLLFHPGTGAGPLFALLALALIVRGIATWAMQAFIACEASQYQLGLVSVFRTAEVLLAVAALAAGGGLIAVASIHLASWTLEAAAGLWLVHARLAAWLSHALAWRRLLSLAKGLVAVSASVSAGTWLRLAPLALYPYVATDAGEVGQFALAWNAALVIATAVLTVMNAAIPVVSRAHARADEKDTYYTSFCIRYGILFGAATVVAGIGIGPWLITAAVGDRYAVAGSLFAMTLLIIAPIVIGQALDQTLFLRGRTRLSLSLNLAALLILIAAFAPVLHTFGPKGVVLTVATVMTAAMVAKIACLHPLAGVSLWGPTLRAAATASAGLAVAAVLVTYSPATAAGIGLTVLVAGIFLTGTIDPRERRFLTTLTFRKKKGADE